MTQEVLSIINSESLENIQKFNNSKKEMKGKLPHCHVNIYEFKYHTFCFWKTCLFYYFLNENINEKENNHWKLKKKGKERVSRWKWKAKQQHQHKIQKLTKQTKTRTKQNEENYKSNEKALYGNDKFWQFMETWGLEFFERNQIVENKWQQ